jgi:hypothetical protein
VQAIRQPYSSIGGKASGAGRLFLYASASGCGIKPALTSWDYERMVLEAFPEI